MADSIGLWAVNDGRLLKIVPGQVDRERRLEDWIESNPDILGERLLLVSRQLQTGFGGIIDLLAVDSEGRCVVIELKRGRTPRDIVARRSTMSRGSLSFPTQKCAILRLGSRVSRSMMHTEAVLA